MTLQARSSALMLFTAGCAVVHPWEALVIGSIGALLTILSVEMFDKLEVDDPVGAVSVHGTSGLWVRLKFTDYLLQRANTNDAKI